MMIVSLKNLRKSHNWIKNYLLNKYASNVNNLLDLAVGKGGDISKWNKNDIKHVTGYDINDVSIAEAKRRVKILKPKTKIKLHVLDLSNCIVKSVKPNFDVITCMFAFHYFFRTKQTFETILKTINKNLKVGGYFIGCFFDGVTVENKLKNNFINKNIFNIIPLKKGNGNFGNEIAVYLKNTVLDEPTVEYLVNFDFFTNEMIKNGYVLIETKMFEEIDNKIKLSLLEKNISYLNRYFVFQRIF